MTLRMLVRRTAAVSGLLCALWLLLPTPAYAAPCGSVSYDTSGDPSPPPIPRPGDPCAGQARTGTGAVAAGAAAATAAAAAVSAVRGRAAGPGVRAPAAPIPSYCKPLDALGRATGVQTTITSEMLENKGSPPGRRIKPPGWLGEAAGHTRGHLLARSLGGDGRAPANIAIMYEKANNVVMEKLEQLIAETVRTRGPVEYSATPVYRNPEDLIPAGIHIKAIGPGLDIDQTVINQ
ncbi:MULTISPECIES: DNA/RNA non-specific endonuclease [Streptomyces]|uniref:DNA/RNA non-specific endonuclease n=2 Tax=Streptomyces TaxID=1883 RepID=UPI0027DE28D9|nr:DNA/RNA non-specific endonuclease [Streptomyces sp. 9-7]